MMRWTEPMLNDDMIEKSSGDLEFEYHQPKHHSRIFKPNQPWDKFSWSTYFNVTRDPKNSKRVLMFYRGNLDSGRTDYHREYTCVAESLDGGYTFKYPQLEIIPYNRAADTKGPPAVKKKKKPKVIVESDSASGKTEKKEDAKKIEEKEAKKIEKEAKKEIANFPPNNIVWKEDGITHNFFALDTQTCENSSYFYAIGGLFASSCRCCSKNVFLMKSGDGFKWSQVKSIIPQNLSAKQGYGTLFDSLNHFLYDPYRQEYRIYFRYNFKRGVRCIQFTTTKDPELWKEKCRPIKFKGVKSGHYYIPSLMMYPNSGYYIGFPCRQLRDSRNKQVLDFIFSRDGEHWNILKSRWLENQPQMASPERFVPHILTSEDGREFLIYMNNAKSTTVELFTIRKDGFGSIVTQQNKKEAWFLTRPFFAMDRAIFMNYQFLDKLGKLVVDILENGKVSGSFPFKENDQISGKMILDPKLVNKKIQLRFKMTHCRIFSFEYQASRDHVDLSHLNMDDYISVVQKDIIGDGEKVEVEEEITKPAIKKPKNKPAPLSNSAKISQKITTKETVTTEVPVLDWSHLKSVNESLKNKPTMEIKYIYFDWKRIGSEGSHRQYKTPKLVTEIKNPRYDRFNETGGGDKQYGRHFTFDVVYQDGTSEVINLVHNSNANCRVVFEA